MSNNTGGYDSSNAGLGSDTAAPGTGALRYTHTPLRRGEQNPRQTGGVACATNCSVPGRGPNARVQKGDNAAYGPAATETNASLA